MRFLRLLMICLSLVWTANAAEPAGAAECAQWRQQYAAGREGLNVGCKTDNDCTQLWPGLCPLQPAYINARSAYAPVFELGKRIATQCAMPKCAKPRRLPLGRCKAGVCAEKRVSPLAPRKRFGSCWDMPIRYLEAGVAVLGHTSEHQTGVTPVLAIGVPATGTLSLEVDWTGHCEACRLRISEHNSGMSRLVEGTRTRTGDLERISLPVREGRYYIGALNPKKTEYFKVVAQLKDAAAKPLSTSFHGRGALRICED